MKEYELLFIVSPRVPADDVPAAIDRVTGFVTSGGGEVLSTDNWGRRRLAYPIKHYFEGTYVLLTLRMPPAAAAPIEASLIISEEVIRHLLTEGIIPQTSRDRGPAAFEDRDRDRAPAPFPPAAAMAPAAAEASVAVAEPPVETPASEAPVPEPAPVEAAPAEANVEAAAALPEADSVPAGPDTETAATEPAPAPTE